MSPLSTNLARSQSFPLTGNAGLNEILLIHCQTQEIARIPTFWLECDTDFFLYVSVCVYCAFSALETHVSASCLTL